MMTNRKLCALALLLGFSVAGWPVASLAERLQVKTSGDISYLSGGVGTPEQEALQQAKADYNLRLLFAASGSGAFLADVPVTIADQSGEVLLEAVSEGPYFYAKLPAGTYGVSAAHAGEVQTRSVTVPATGGVSEDFRWSVPN